MGDMIRGGVNNFLAQKTQRAGPKDPPKNDTKSLVKEKTGVNILQSPNGNIYNLTDRAGGDEDLTIRAGDNWSTRWYKWFWGGKPE